MRELVPSAETGECEITGLPTSYKYNGKFLFLEFLTAANKLCNKYPDKTFDQAMEIVLSAQIYRNTLGEDKMDVKELKKRASWKEKLAGMMLR